MVHVYRQSCLHQAYKKAITIHIAMAQSLKKLHSFFLLTFTIASIASDMSRHMNGFAILDSIIFRNAIELTAITILCHNHSNPSRGGGPKLAACFRQPLS